MRRFFYLLISLIFHFPLSGQPFQSQTLNGYSPMEMFSLQNPLRKQNDAHITYRVESGELRQVYAPESNHRYGVYISSTYPLGHTGITGRAGYTRYYRKKQRYCGMFRPASPLIAFADTIPGNQKGEIYYLAGSIVHSFSTCWNSGLAIEYLAGNNAKDTDPRNKNNLNHIALAPNFLYRLKNIQLGMTLFWRYGRETVSYGSFGHETKNGVTFYPLWFYTTESFVDGLNAQRDYRSNFYRGDLNLQYKGKTWKTTLSPSYSQSHTHIWINPAKKQSAGEMTEENFRIENTTYFSTLRHIHRFTPRFSHSRQKVYDVQQQLSTDNRIYETILKIKRAEVTHLSAGIHYMISPASHPDRILKAGLEYKKQHSLFRLPPTDFKQEIRQFHFSANYARSFLVKGHLLNGDLQTDYFTGSGTQPDLSPLSDKTIFQVQRHLLDREFRYLTASILGISIRLKYTFPLNKNETTFYMETQNQFLTTCHNSGWSAQTNTFTFSVGISF